MDGRGDRRRADERTTRRRGDGPLGRPGRAPAGTPAPLQVARHGAALGSRASGVVCHHSRGFPVAGEHHVGSRRAAAGELACQTYPSGVGGYAALEAGSPGRSRKPQALSSSARAGPRGPLAPGRRQVELGEAGGQGRVIEPAAGEPGVELAEGAGVGAAGVGADRGVDQAAGRSRCRPGRSRRANPSR